MSVRELLINRPRLVSTILVAAVGIHAGANWLWGVPSIGRALATVGAASDLYLGAAAAVALVGGTAGIVVVFAMTQGLRRFAVLRASGGRSLELNWIHPISLSFSSAGCLLIAAFLTLIDHAGVAGWLSEVAAVLAAHAAARLVWLLSHLVTTVRLQDVDDLQPRATIEEAVPRRSAKRVAATP